MARLYFYKRFQSGALKGLRAPSWRDFPDYDTAWQWARSGKTGRDALTRTTWKVEDPTFQKTAR